jgi:hypothetical protein
VLILLFSKQNSGNRATLPTNWKNNEKANGSFFNVSDEGILFKLSLRSLVQIPWRGVNSPQFFNYMRHDRCLVIVLNVIFVAISTAAANRSRVCWQHRNSKQMELLPVLRFL